MWHINTDLGVRPSESNEKAGVCSCMLVDTLPLIFGGVSSF